MKEFRAIPKVDKLLAEPLCQELLAVHPKPVLVSAIRSVLDSVRSELAHGSALPPETMISSILNRIEQTLRSSEQRSLRRVVNGTGVVIHTNLGRSPLPEEVVPALLEIAQGYSNLEYDLPTGGRGTRYDHVEELLCFLTGAEAALVVNNNAAAVLLALSCLAAGREVIVSRGELVEIGGSFRIPEVMAQGGAILREVGTTNRTHPKDYAEAVTERTSLLLKVHTSNFAMIGFTREVSIKELKELGAAHALPVMADLGSGSFLRWPDIPMLNEPTVQEYLKEGADLVTCSGDKLLGGPQSGILLGRKALLDQLKKHPLLRALRIDKLTLAALEGTLRLYRDERTARASVPTLRMLSLSEDELDKRGKKLRRRLHRQLPAYIHLNLHKGVSHVGGGALPLVELPTTLLSISLPSISPDCLEKELRQQPVPVIGRIAKGAFLLDLRTMADDDWQYIAEGLRAALRKGTENQCQSSH